MVSIKKEMGEILQATEFLLLMYVYLYFITDFVPKLDI